MPDLSPIAKVIAPKEKDLGAVSVRRALPAPNQRMVGPWIFFDHFGPATFPPDGGVDVRPHPHINLATVTYLFEGELRHRDSLGSDVIIRPGAINLMVAGRGVTHSERPTEHESDYDMEGLQLWHALPEAEEEREPSFHHYGADDIPEFSIEGVSGRVMMGSAFGMTSPVKIFHPTLYFEATLEGGAILSLPDVEELALYPTAGDLSVDGQDCPLRKLSVLDGSVARQVSTREGGRFAAIGGAPMGPRFIEWNFVSSRRDRIAKAKRDWAERRFPTVPGDEDERIPLPEETRVAHYP